MQKMSSWSTLGAKLFQCFYHRRYDDDIGIDWSNGHKGILQSGYSGKCDRTMFYLKLCGLGFTVTP